LYIQHIMKKTHLLLSLLSIFLTFHVSPTLSYDKRDYTSRQYYTLHTSTTPSNAEIAKRAASSLGARFEGQVGELSQYYWISIPMSPSLNKRSLIDQFHVLKRKRDLDWNFVDDIQIQTPTHRLHKRAPPPPYPIIENTEEEYKLNGDAPPIILPSLDDTDGYERIKDLLNIHDPGFDQQWHLVNIFSVA
jgi:kexin